MRAGLGRIGESMTGAKSIFRFKRFQDVYLASTDMGTWMFLTSSEFDALMRLQTDQIEPDLYKRLYERNFIVDPSQLEREVNTLHVKFGGFFDGPKLFIIGITEACNLQCHYCHAGSQPYQVANSRFSDETIAKIVEFILGCMGDHATIEFQGGEPLLDFSTICRFIEKIKSCSMCEGKHFRYSLSTNLTLLTNQMCKYLADNDVRVVGSIDGPMEVHDLQRCYKDGRGTHDEILRAIERARREGVSLSLIAVLTKNSLENVHAIVDELVNHGESEIALNWPQRNGRALEPRFWDMIGLDSYDYSQLWKQSVEYIATLTYGSDPPITERYLELILHKILTPYSPNYMDWRSPCGAIIGQISFDHEGNIYPCDDARGDKRLIIGNVHKNTFSDVMKREISQQVIGASLLENEICDYCVYKPFCGICPVLSFKAGGDFQSFREFSYRCHIFTSMFDFVFLKILDGDTSVFSFAVNGDDGVSQ